MSSFCTLELVGQSHHKIIMQTLIHVTDKHCRQTIQHKQEFPAHMWSACLGALFAYFQRADSVLPNSDGPLSTAVPVSTIMAANRDVKPVLHYPARQRGRTLRPPSDAMLMGVVNWVTVISESFLLEKLFSSNS